MFVSLFLAKVIGLYMVITGFFYLLKKDMIQEIVEDWLAHPAISAFGAILALIVGLLIVLSHNVWTTSWVVVITLIGYMSLLKGIWRLFFPHLFVDLAQHVGKKPGHLIIGGVTLAIGLWLSIMGFTQTL